MNAAKRPLDSSDLVVPEDVQRIVDMVPEWLSPIPCIVPGQLLSLYLAAARDYDPDRPRGLRKITETR